MMAEKSMNSLWSDEGVSPHNRVGGSAACTKGKKRRKEWVEINTEGEISRGASPHPMNKRQHEMEIIELGCRLKDESREKPYGCKRRQMRATTWLRQPA